MGLFIQPDIGFFASVEEPAFTAQGGKAYSYYNYLSGFSSRIKKLHFGAALNLTKQYFHKSNVIDFGCADGIFLPSLARYFNHVIAIDTNVTLCQTAQSLIETHELGNVEILCNAALGLHELPARISSRSYNVMYLLEVMEHVGEPLRMYESKLDFLVKLQPMLSPEGVFVISVPVMTGLPFLFQRLALTLLRQYKEPISWKDFLKASFFKNTSNLESDWTGGHLGFNHHKLEEKLEEAFVIVKKRNLFFQQVFLLRGKPPQCS